MQHASAVTKELLAFKHNALVQDTHFFCLLNTLNISVSLWFDLSQICYLNISAGFDNHKELLASMFNALVPEGLTFLRKSLKETVDTVDNNVVASCFNIMDFLLMPWKRGDGTCGCESGSGCVWLWVRVRVRVRVRVQVQVWVWVWVKVWVWVWVWVWV